MRRTLFSKMAGDQGILMSRFLEAEVIIEV